MPADNLRKPRYSCVVRRALPAALALLIVGLPVPGLAQQGPENVFSVESNRGTDIAGVVMDSLNLLMIEHGTRVLFQEKTRRELTGPFWSDYAKSVRRPGQWGDTDSFGVNYIGHPIHGAAAGYLWLDHDPKAPVTLSMTKSYWASRGRATAWSAAYSLQFEIGPLSEASIGNVGMNPVTTGWVDHVVTPLGALGFMVAEDAMDQYVVRVLERYIGNSAARAALRVALNPGRALSNSASGRMPWSRVERPLGWR